MDGLLTVNDLKTVPLGALEEQITSFAGYLAAAQARWIVWIAEYDRRNGWHRWQAKSCAHWLNWRCGVSMRTAREYVRVARRLDELPHVRQEFLAGAISYSKVRALTRVADEHTEAELVRLAKLSTASQAEKLCGGVARAQSAEDEEAQARDAIANQTIVYTNNHDGTATIKITAPIADVKRSHAAVVEAGSQRIEEARAPGRPSTEVIDELGGVGRILAETALDILSGTADAVDAPVDDVMLVVDHDTLAEDTAADTAGAESDRRRGTCTFGGEHISPLVARRLSCDARLQIALEDAVADALGIGRRSRIVPRWLRRKLARRDHGMCRFPGCAATRRLHAHHIIHWENGGLTDLDNLVLLCGFHHTSVHEGGWNITVVDGAHVFLDPVGNPVRVPELVNPHADRPFPEPECAAGKNGSAEPLSGLNERYDIADTASTIATNAMLRRELSLAQRHATDRRSERASL